MKIFWTVFFVAFLVFIVVNAIRGRRYSDSVYRARFFNRMPRRQPDEAANDSAFFVSPMLFGVGSESSHHAAPDCAPGVGHAGGVDAGGGCGDGGGSSSH